MALVDRFGRIHDYLRISVTDRCNLRCVYCMPAEGMKFLDESEVMTDEEIVQIVTAGAELGISKLRLTGGEPTVRRGLTSLIQKLSAIPGITDIALTTNGMSLRDQAQELYDAGVSRLNLSLDSMKAEPFQAITRFGEFSRVWEGLEKAVEVGFSPIKLNIVLVGGFNEGEIVDFLRLTERWPLAVRFIEYMPIGQDAKAWRKRYVPLDTVFTAAQEAGINLLPGGEVRGNGPAQYYQIPGAPGHVGFIHPVSDHFCETCNRLRLTADGKLKPCLYWADEVTVRDCVNQPEQLRALFYRALALKPEKHEMAKAGEMLESGLIPTSRVMSQIGG